jgi:pimeloyl-ACP methyl ester carboxylesterase
LKWYTTNPLIGIWIFEEEAEVATFVLIHGAWASGWFWHKTAVFLVDAGHRVYAPSLTGLGERTHLLHPEVGLDTHVQDVLGILEYEDLREVVLVGWSYGGWVIPGVASQATQRLEHLVYLDAGAPRVGDSILLDQSPASQEWLLEQARTVGSGWWVPPPTEGAFAHYVQRGELTLEEMRAMVARQRPHPLKSLQDPIRVANPYPDLDKTYIFCTVEQAANGARSMRFVQENGWRCQELRAAHYAIITHPREVANLLLGIL